MEVLFSVCVDMHIVGLHSNSLSSYSSLYSTQIYYISQCSPFTNSITNHVSLERMDPKLTKWIGTLNTSIGLQSVMHSNKILSFACLQDKFLQRVVLPFAFLENIYVMVLFKKCWKGHDHVYNSVSITLKPFYYCFYLHIFSI